MLSNKNVTLAVLIDIFKVHLPALSSSLCSRMAAYFEVQIFERKLGTAGVFLEDEKNSGEISKLAPKGSLKKYEYKSKWWNEKLKKRSLNEKLTKCGNFENSQKEFYKKLNESDKRKMAQLIYRITKSSIQKIQMQNQLLSQEVMMNNKNIKMLEDEVEAVENKILIFLRHNISDKNSNNPGVVGMKNDSKKFLKDHNPANLSFLINLFLKRFPF